MDWATLPTNFSEAWMSLRKVMIIVARMVFLQKSLKDPGMRQEEVGHGLTHACRDPRQGQQAEFGGDWTPAFEIADAVGMLARRWRRYGALLTVALRC